MVDHSNKYAIIGRMIAVRQNQVSVDKLPSACTQVTLIGPDVSKWVTYDNWYHRIMDEWRNHCKLYPSKGVWAVSDEISNQEFKLHFWFSSASDALVFKLSHGSFIRSEM